MKIVLAPNFKITATLVEIEPKNIVGFPKHLIPNEDAEGAFCPFPMPIAMQLQNGMHELITPMEWLRDIQEAKFSRIACLSIPSVVDETLARDASILINIVHANRSQSKPCDLVKLLLSNSRYHEIVRDAYNFDPIRKLPSLIGAHAIKERTIRRIKSDMAESIWETFRRRNPEAWSFERIVNSFKNQKKAKERLVKRILGSQDNPEAVWNLIKNTLQKRGVYHG